MKVGEVYIDIEARDAYSAKFKAAQAKTKAFGTRVGSSLNTVRTRFAGLGTAAALAGVAMGAFFVMAARRAMDAIETQQKFSVVFQEVTEEANAAAEALASGYGLANSEAQSLLANTGDLLTGFGMSGAAALEMSNDVQELAADLASFTNIEGGTAAASQALTKALLGEREGVKALGIVIRESDVTQRVAAMGMANATGEARLQARAQATLAIAYSQSTNAIGDFARSASSPANIVRRLQATFRNITEQIGKTLMPGFKDLGQAMISASQDGGVLINAAKAIGKALSTLMRAISWLVQAMESIGRESAMEDALEEQGRRAGGTAIALGQLRITMETVRSTGLSSAQGIRNFSQMLRDLNSVQGENRPLAQRMIGNLQHYNRLLIKSVAAQNDNMTAVNRTTNAYANSRQALVDIENRLSGITNTVEAEVTARNRARAATNNGTTANVAAAKALAKLRKEAQRFIETYARVGMSDTDRIRADREEQLRILEEYQDKAVISEQQYNQTRSRINQQYDQLIMQSRMRSFQAGIGVAQDIVGQIGQIFAMAAQNQQARVNADQQDKLSKEQAAYEAEKARINREIKDEKKRNAALEKLEEKHNKAQEKINLKYEKKKRKIAHENAMIQKAINISQAIMNTAIAATRALIEGPFAGPVLAALMIALGSAQVALIASQPLPALAEGGFFQGPALIGEAGREFAFPLDGFQGRNAMDLLAGRLVANVERRTETEATIDPITEGGGINLTIHFADEVWQEHITQGTRDRTILIDKGALI